VAEITIDAHSESIYHFVEDAVWADAHGADTTSGVEDAYVLYLMTYHTDQLEKYRLRRVGLRFDTTPIPAGATILSAKLRLYFTYAANWGGSTLYIPYTGEHLWNSGYVGEFSDYLPYVTPVSTPVSLSDIVDDEYTEFSFDADGRLMIHNATGDLEAEQERGTVIPIRLSHDALNITPGDNFDTGGSAILSGSTHASPPQLYVEYTTATPTVQTDAATSVAKDSATLNGTLTEDAGMTCQCSFEYGETEAFGSTTTPEGKTKDQTFSSDLTDLLFGTKYYFRAKAVHPVIGTVYGSTLSFTTTGVSYPVDAITRVTNLVHRYNRATGLYVLEISLGEVTDDFGLPFIELGSPRATAEKDEDDKTKRTISRAEKTIDERIDREIAEWNELRKLEAEAYARVYPGPQWYGPMGPPTTKRIDYPLQEFLPKAPEPFEPTLWSKITPWKEEAGETFPSALQGMIRTVKKTVGLFERTPVSEQRVQQAQEEQTQGWEFWK